MKKFGIILVLVLALSLFLFYPTLETVFYKQASYSDFITLLDDSKIESLTVDSDKLVYTVDGDDAKYYTVNPHSASLNERALLSGAKLELKDSSSDSFNAVLDVIFNVLFIGIICFGLYKLIGTYKKTFQIVKKTGVDFSSIAGLDDVKRDMGVIVDMLKRPGEYQKKGIRIPKGIILEGPPGNGKTLFARALAKEAGINLIAAKGADFQSALMSMGSFKIKMLFAKAKRHKPCIIFIDEFDSIGEKRNYAGTGVDKENNRIITAMLNEMDGFVPSSNVIVIAATNSYQALDPALIRPGRFDLKYHIGLPDAVTREKLASMYLNGKNVSDGITATYLSELFEGLSCSAIETVINEAGLLSSQLNKAVDIDIIRQAAIKTNVELKNKRH